MTTRAASGRCLLVLAALCACSLVEPARAAARPQVSAARPSTADMERQLLMALNAERAARGLQALREMPVLVTLARRHSAEQARRDVASHDSEEGASYQRRLSDAGIAWAASGENVGRSGTFLTALIHQTFMDSAGHRENMLNPAFDAVGVGVVLGEHGTYFLTMDFIKAVPLKPAGDIRTIMLEALTRARARSGQAPAVLADDLNRAADDLARAKLDGRPISQFAVARRRTSTRFVTGVDLDQLAAALADERFDGFGLAGIGSAFGRTPDAPAGTYVICVVLVWTGS